MAEPKNPPVDSTLAPSSVNSQDSGYSWNEEKQIWLFHNPAGSMAYNYLYRDSDELQSPPTAMQYKSARLIDQDVLKQMLYHAIHVPPGQAPVPPEIVAHPLIAGYAAGWGRKNDIGIIAWAGEKPIGAAWVRSWENIEPKGFGYINEQTPELTMAVLPAYRNQGIGTSLLENLFDAVKENFTAISLSVQITNPAKHLYERFGFKIYKQTESDWLMVKRFTGA